MRLPTRVAIVDDHRFLAQTLALALQDSDFDAVLIDPHDDVVARVGQWRAAVVLLDLNLEGDVSGDDLIPALAVDRAVVVLTAENDEARWGRCMLGGAVGVLSKSSPLEDIVAAVARAASGEPVVDELKRMTWLRAADHDRTATESALAPFRRLTPREEEVLAALVDGEPAVAIAERATVSEATVRSHIRSVLTKLGVGSQLQAVAQARRAGWTRDREGRREAPRG
ncbi:MAG TPA: response regulator transcription factor [Actinomycetales bacterium]|nr:response regulator transcription factor [Actinomycetales bacterium]